MQPGSRVALVAPASPLARSEFEAGCEELRRLGLEPVFDESGRFREGPAARPRDMLCAVRDCFLLGPFGAVVLPNGMLIRQSVINLEGDTLQYSLAQFTGNGHLTLAITARDGSVTTGAGNSLEFYMSQAGAYARVTYTYASAPVPEPSTWALSLASLGLMGVIARRRSK